MKMSLTEMNLYITKWRAKKEDTIEVPLEFQKPLQLHEYFLVSIAGNSGGDPSISVCNS
jgi:hypothetical protein